jgi:Zn-dependent peptidase ImmA (M78 family)
MLAIEQRANAFAAETLLPRKEAARVYRQAANLEQAVKALVITFDVSRQVVKAQIKNSGAASSLDLTEIDSALSTYTSHR